MSPGAPSAPVSYIPTPTAPITYQSLIPQFSYQDAAEYLKGTTDQLNKQLQVQYQQVGTPAELGARAAGTRMAADAAYLASMPRETQGTAAYNALSGKLAQSQQDYGTAVQQAKIAPPYNQFTYQTPSWATHPDSAWAVKDTSKDTSTKTSTSNPTEAEKEAQATSTTQSNSLYSQYGIM